MSPSQHCWSIEYVIDVTIVSRPKPASGTRRRHIDATGVRTDAADDPAVLVSSTQSRPAHHARPVAGRHTERLKPAPAVGSDLGQAPG